MPDIRQRVKDDRGLLKRIQLFVPGFRGYRQREDLRDSDRMLRDQIAKKIGQQRKALEDSRALIVNSYGSKELELLGGVINEFKKTEGLVSHSSPGYSGIAADLEFKEDQIYRLYDFDASMIDGISAISQGIEQMKSSLVAGDSVKSQRDILQIKVMITNFEDQFKRRMLIITGTEV